MPRMQNWMATRFWTSIGQILLTLQSDLFLSQNLKKAVLTIPAGKLYTASRQSSLWSCEFGPGFSSVSSRGQVQLSPASPVLLRQIFLWQAQYPPPPLYSKCHYTFSDISNNNIKQHLNSDLFWLMQCRFWTWTCMRRRLRGGLTADRNKQACGAKGA